jgi:metal-dependent amidase/aminoacylase/carboxypeptidase family protein
MLHPKIKDSISQYKGELTELRRKLHSEPELSWQEHTTQSVIINTQSVIHTTRSVIVTHSMCEDNHSICDTLNLSRSERQGIRGSEMY